ARLWEISSGKELRTLRGHSQPISSLAFSPDGKRIATGSEDHTVKIWDTDSGEELITLTHSGGVGDLAFSRDGHVLIGAGRDNVIRVWRAATERDVQANLNLH